jgi:hypothetical protein
VKTQKAMRNENPNPFDLDSHAVSGLEIGTH